MPTPEDYVWCISCGRAARREDWVALGGTCPGCGAVSGSMFEWDYIRRMASRLPQEPETGHDYRLADYKD